MAQFWFMSACDPRGYPEGEKVDITARVLRVAEEEVVDENSEKQEIAAQALMEAEYVGEHETRILLWLLLA